MKKILFLSLFSLLFVPTATPLQAQALCAQVIQVAVDSHGVCKEFATPCDVPSDWKQLPGDSCDNVETDTHTSSNVDTTSRNRYNRWSRALHNKAVEKVPEIKKRKYKRRSDRSRIGTGGLTRNNDTIDSVKNRKRASLATKDKRTFTKKSYDSDFIQKRRQYRTNKGGYQQDRKTTKEEREKRRRARPAFMSRSEAIREGELSNDPKLEERLKKRSTSRSLKRYGQRTDIRQRVKKKKRVKKVPTNLRRTFRGNTSERRNATVSEKDLLKIQDAEKAKYEAEQAQYESENNSSDDSEETEE